MMMNDLRRWVVGLVLVMGLGLGLWGSQPVPAQAQAPDGSLETTLAQAAARSFLVSLTRPELAGVREFYLLESVNVDGLLAELSEPPVTGFEIVQTGWISPVSYRVTAVLAPSQRQMTLYSGQYAGRWRIEGVDLATAGDATAPPTGATTPTTGTTSVAAAPAQPVSDNGGGFLVFQTRSGGDIYLIHADGSGLRRLTQGMDPQLSPDGRQIAFTRWQPAYELFTMNLDGSGERSWAKGWRQMKSPTWSADGQRIVFSFQSGGRLEDEQRRVDLAAAARNEDGVHIPGEAREVEVENGILRYRLPMDAHWYLKQVDLTNGQVSDPATGRYSYGPSFHPSDPNLLLYRGREGVGWYDARTNTARPVSHDFRDRAGVLSPDGQKIALSYWQDGHWEVHTLNADGSNRQRLTSTPVEVLAERTELNRELIAGQERVVAGENPHWNNGGPAWSPDGREIAFLTDRTGKWEIWIMNADGTEQRPMFTNGALAELTLEYAGVDERMISWR